MVNEVSKLLDRNVYLNCFVYVHIVNSIFWVVCMLVAFANFGVVSK